MGKKKNIINRFMSGSFPDEVKLAFGSWLTDPEDQQEKEDALYSEWEALSARDISDSTLERRRMPAVSINRYLPASFSK